MTKETLESKFKDRGLTLSDTVRVEIVADGSREDEFQRLRQAVKDVLGHDSEVNHD